MPAGYYDQFTVTTDITNVSGTLSYIYHHHATAGTDIHVNDSESETGGVADNYQNSENAGCFTKPYYHLQFYCYHPSSAVSHSDSDNWGTVDCSYYCNICGASAHDHYNQSENVSMSTCHRRVTSQWNSIGPRWVDKWTYSAPTDMSQVTEVVYERTCGLVEGQMTGAKILY